MLKKILIYGLAFVFALAPFSYLIGQELPSPSTSSWSITGNVITYEYRGEEFSFSRPSTAADKHLFDKSGKKIIKRNIEFFLLDLSPENRASELKPLTLIVGDGDNREDFGKIIKFGLVVPSNSKYWDFILNDREDIESGTKIENLSLTYANYIKNSDILSRNEDKNRYHEFYKHIHNNFQEQSGQATVIKQGADVNIDNNLEGELEIPENIYKDCLAKLNIENANGGPIDLNNPPPELASIFDEWNKNFENDEKLVVPVIDQEVTEINNNLFRKIIPPITQIGYITKTQSDTRGGVVSSEMDRLHEATQDLWKKDDAESTFGTQLKYCLVGIASGALIGTIVPVPGIGTISGGILGYASCLGGSVGANELAKKLRGSNVPKRFTTSVIAIYYNMKYLSYLKCMTEHEDYSSLDEEIQEKIESEIEKIEAQIRQLTLLGDEAKDQSEDPNYLGKIAERLKEWVNKIVESIFNILNNLLNNVPV